MKIFNPKYKTNASRFGKADAFVVVETSPLSEDFLYSLYEEDIENIEKAVEAVLASYVGVEGAEYILRPNKAGEFADCLSPSEARMEIVRWAKFVSGPVENLAAGAIYIPLPSRTCVYVYGRGSTGRVDEADPYNSGSGGSAPGWKMDGRPVEPPIPAAVLAAVEAAVWAAASTKV